MFFAPVSATTLLRELDQVADAVGRRVTDGVREAEARGAVIDRRLEERRQHLGARARRVLGHVGNREPGLDADVDRVRAPLRDERKSHCSTYCRIGLDPMNM
jgi:sirohydrochlorin ferrochelatase